MRIIQIVGYKNSGKTTLTCELVRELAKQGRRVGTLKHDAHDFEPDVPGKDTWKHRQAGAHITAITSPSRTAWVQEQAMPIERLVSQMESQSVDFLLIEGFKTASYPKIVLLRSEEDAELLDLPNIISVVVRESNENIEEMTNNRTVPLFVQRDILSFGPLVEYVSKNS